MGHSQTRGKSTLIRITNYNSALGRLLAPVVLVPLLVLAAYIYEPLWRIFSRTGGFASEALIGALIVLGSLVVVLLPLRGVVFWLEVGAEIRVRGLFGLRAHSWDDVSSIAFGRAAGFAAGRRLLLKLKSRKRLRVAISEDEEISIKELLAQHERGSVECPERAGVVRSVADGALDVLEELAP